MAEAEEEKPVNPKTVKGVDTGSDGDGGPKNNKPTLPEFRSELAYREPKTQQEAWASGLGSAAFESRSGSAIQGSDFLVSSGVRNLYTPIDLAKGIPDKFEREKFINENGSRMVQLLDPDKFGVRFERDLQDYATFREKNYNTQIKKFLDDLDENQGILAEAGNTIGKLTGLAWGIAGVIPTIYGVGSALFNWDASKLFNNAGFDMWQAIDDKINSKFAVYGGSDYHSGNRNFFARFINHPMKSLNADIMPAVNFVGSAVATEILATAAAPFTGGATLMANTSRLAAQATNMFSKSYKVLRGIDQLADFANMRQIASLTQKYRAGLGTATSMVRSAGLESSLIARSTYDQTLQKSKQNYLSSQGFSEEEISRILGNQEMEEAVIGAGVLAGMKKSAEDASELAWFTNIPLVGFSNMIQFSKAFTSGYKVNQALNRLNPLKLTGTVAKGGKVVARADAMGKGARAAAYTGAVLKPGIVEGFEEYAQGVTEEGYSDYWSSGYTDDAVRSSTSFLGAMTKAARNYGGSVEGFDSMTIGFLMGMVGIRLPMKIDSTTGKLTRGWETYGGARQEFKELKKQIAEDRATAKIINDNPINPVLKNNFENMAKNITIQADMDKALAKGDIFNYKNKEYEQLHSYVSNRVKNGIGETVPQEIDALAQLPLNTFNEQFSVPGVLEFTEETKKVAIEKLKNNVNNIMEAHAEVDTAFNDSKLFVDFWRKNFKGVTDPLDLVEPLKEQMTFLYGATKNLENREAELQSQINKATKGNVNPSVLNKLIAEIGEINKDNKAEFATTAREIYKAELNNWKENDSTSYNLYRKQIEPLLQDLILIKERKAKISKMYDVLFTNKGAKQFLDVYLQLKTNADALAAEVAAKKAEEDAKTARSSDTLNKVAADEKSVTGATTAVDDREAAEIAATDQEMASIIAGLKTEDGEAINAGNLSDLVSSIDSDSVLSTLQSKPALFRAIIQKLEEDGMPIPGLTNIDQLPEILADNPTASARISAALAEILKSFNENKEVNTSTQPLDYADPSDASQPAPSESEATTFEEFFNTKTQKAQELSIYQAGTNVSDLSIIPVLHDKLIVDTVLVRDPKTGRYKSRQTDQPVDLKKVNSPDFLNNKELHNNNVEATFKVEETKPYMENGKLVEIDDTNIRINVYQGDTFIGQLPAYKPGMPAHFLALRKAIVAQESGIAIEEETVSTDAKADIEKKLFSETDSKGRTVTVFSTTKEKDGVIKTTFTFNRSDKDPSQRNKIITGIPVEKALGDKYTIDKEYIPEGAKVIGVSEIRISKTGAAASVTFEDSEGNTFQGEVVLNSNTSYDAELAALEGTQKQPVDNTKAIQDKQKEIAELEKQKKELKTKTAETTVTEEPYKPKAFTGYSAGAFWETTPNKQTNISLYRLEKDSENSDKGLLYFDPDLEMGFGRTLNSPDRIIKTFFEIIGDINQQAKGIKTIKPAIVRKNAKGLTEVVEKGVVEFVDTPMSNTSLSRPGTSEESKTITEKIDTTEIDSKIAKAKEELDALKQTPSRKEIIDNNFNDIIKQLLKSKVNVFFNEQFKKEC